MPSPYRICFVCSGNICRSPAAEVIVRELALRDGLSDADLVLDSAGTGDWHVGEPADRRAVRALRMAGFDGSAHRARAFDPDWFADLDLVIALDRGHERALRSWAPDGPARDRVRLLRSFDPAAPAGPGADLDVADPYYGPDSGFTVMVAQIEQAGAGLLDHVRSQRRAART